jgi:hypothetical protein
MADRGAPPGWRQALAGAAADPGVRAMAVLFVFVLAGFAGIALAWRGTAARLPVSLQLPFVLSAGLGGAALLGSAIVLLSVQLGRRERAVERLQVDLLIRSSAAIAEAVLAQRRSAQRRAALVAVGRTLHRTGCRFADRRPGRRPIGAAAAAAEGLRPCRVCRPVSPAPAGRSGPVGEEPQL